MRVLVAGGRPDPAQHRRDRAPLPSRLARCLALGSNAIVALIDEWLYEAFVEVYRLPFRKIGVGQHYMGTDPVPVAMALFGDNYLDMARTNPHFYAWCAAECSPQESADWNMPIVLVDAGDDD